MLYFRAGLEGEMLEEEEARLESVTPKGSRVRTLPENNSGRLDIYGCLQLDACRFFYFPIHIYINAGIKTSLQPSMPLRHRSRQPVKTECRYCIDTDQQPGRLARDTPQSIARLRIRLPGLCNEEYREYPG